MLFLNIQQPGTAAYRAMISDLQTEKWAVLSERGCEATQLTYEKARRLVHKLASEGHHGLCIVTNEAAALAGSAGQKIDLAAMGESSLIDR